MCGVLLLLAGAVVYSAPDAANSGTASVAAAASLQIGNFLAESGSWTSMTLMSDYLHNGTTPDRAASDIERAKIIRRAGSFGNTIHLYGTNDDNYSRRRGPMPGWENIPDRRLFYEEEDFHHWFHWFAECRRAGLEIVLWLWPNDAAGTYNSEAVWPDAKVLEQMRRLVTFASTPWEGKPLVKDFVLKLEADDEWSIPRINRLAKAVRAMLPPGARLWYHNQTTDCAVLKQVDWAPFDGIRYQLSERSGREAVQRECRELIAALPAHLLFVGSEYTVDGQSVEARRTGDWILELRDRFPRIAGVDNAATTDRWIK